MYHSLFSISIHINQKTVLHPVFTMILLKKERNMYKQLLCFFFEIGFTYTITLLCDTRDHSFLLMDSLYSLQPEYVINYYTLK